MEDEPSRLPAHLRESHKRTHINDDWLLHTSIGSRSLFLLWRSSNFSKFAFYWRKRKKLFNERIRLWVWRLMSNSEGFGCLPLASFLFFLLWEVGFMNFLSPPKWNRNISCSKTSNQVQTAVLSACGGGWQKDVQPDREESVLKYDKAKLMQLLGKGQNSSFFTLLQCPLLQLQQCS